MLSWDDYMIWLDGLLTKVPLPQVAAPQPGDIVTDSRTMNKGGWFLPLRGENFDGHDFVKSSLDKGAAGFFYELDAGKKIPREILSRGVAVTNALSSLQAIAKGWRKRMRQVQVLALTGSAGKTTTKEMTACIASEAGESIATQGSLNNEIGVPLTLLRLKPETKFAIIEMAARHLGDIGFLARIAEPDVAACLNVGTAHIGEFGGARAILATKLEIFQESPLCSICVAFHDDGKILRGAEKTEKTVISFGQDPKATVVLKSGEYLKNGGMAISLLVGETRVEINLPVAHSIYPINVAAACAIALAANIDTENMQIGLAKFKGVTSRYQVHKKGTLTIIDDTYNANPESMAAGLETLARAYKGTKKVVVLGDMLELGQKGGAAHQKIGKLVKSLINPELLVTVGPQSKAIAKGAQAQGLAAKRIASFETVEDLLKADLPLTSLGNVIYAKASHGINLKKFIDSLLMH